MECLGNVALTPMAISLAATQLRENSYVAATEGISRIKLNFIPNTPTTKI